MANPWYRANLGAYTFDVAPEIPFVTRDVIRTNVNPSTRVATYYEVPLACRVRADTPPASVTALNAFLTSNVNTGTLPVSLQIKDQAGAVIAGIGDIREETSENWEDLELVDFELEQGARQLVAGATFKVTFRARRSFPDASGICEFEQDYEEEADGLGREVKRLVSRIRLLKRTAAPAVGDPTIGVTTTDAIRDQLKLAQPAGWTRTKGSASLGFTVRYPRYPLKHVAECTSEVTKNNGVSASSGANKADTGDRVVERPELGIKEIISTAETTGPADPEGWVLDSAPTERQRAETFVSLARKTAKGEWVRIESLSADSKKTTKVVRVFELHGGGRPVGSVPMSSPVRPVIQRGAFEAYVVTESIEAYALDPREFDDFDVPKALGAPFVLASPRETLPKVYRDAFDPTQRLWVWALLRTYMWNSEKDPKRHQAFKDAVFAAAQETF